MRILLVATTLFFSTFVYAQQGSASKQKRIVKLMELAGATEVLESMKVTLKESYKRNLPDVDPAFWDEYFGELSTEGLIRLIVPVYDKHFTDEDISALIAFYESPVGRKMMGKMPLIMQESMAAGEQWGMQIGQRVQERLKERQGK